MTTIPIKSVNHTVEPIQVPVAPVPYSYVSWWMDKDVWDWVDALCRRMDFFSQTTYVFLNLPHLPPYFITPDRPMIPLVDRDSAILKTFTNPRRLTNYVNILESTRCRGCVLFDGFVVDSANYGNASNETVIRSTGGKVSITMPYDWLEFIDTARTVGDLKNMLLAAGLDVHCGPALESNPLHDFEVRLGDVCAEKGSDGVSFSDKFTGIDLLCCMPGAGFLVYTDGFGILQIPVEVKVNPHQAHLYPAAA